MEAHLQKTRLEMNFPAWLADGLRQLSITRKESMNQLVLSAVLKEYPELKELQQSSFIRRLLRKPAAPGAGAPGVTVGSEPVADPGQATA